MRVNKGAALGTPLAVMLALAMFFTSGCGAGKPEADTTTSFYRARVEVSTTAEGAALDVDDPDVVLTMRVASSSGTADTGGASVERIWLRRAAPRPETGEAASMAVDCALDPEAARSGFALALAQRGTGTTDVRLSSGTDGSMRVLAEASAQAGQTGEVRLSPRDIAALPLETARLEPPAPRMIWSTYYNWYDSLSNWDSGTLSDRPAEPYVSEDRAAIERHVKQAKSAGIDGFMASWWGPRSYSDKNLETLLDVAKENDFSVGINFETLGAKDTEGKDHPLDEEALYRWLGYAISKYADHPAFMKVDGRPVFCLWASGAVPLETWAGVLGKLRADGLDACCLGHVTDAHPNLAALEVFDGLHAYSVLDFREGPDSPPAEGLAQAYASAGRGVRNYGLLAGAGGSKIWAPVAQPGYDDHLLPDRDTPVVDREDGAFFEATFEAALASDPDWVCVTSWNEWWEHTYIEPSEKYGDTYLELTRAAAAGWAP